MTKPIATDPIVFAAADALYAQGVELTVLLVREQTKGSYTTVQNAAGPLAGGTGRRADSRASAGPGQCQGGPVRSVGLDSGQMNMRKRR